MGETCETQCRRTRNRCGRGADYTRACLLWQPGGQLL